MTRRSAQGYGRIFRWPLCLALATIAGLVSGLLGDGGLRHAIGLCRPREALGLGKVAEHLEALDVHADPIRQQDAQEGKESLDGA